MTRMEPTELFCARCGLAAPLDSVVKPCDGCGFVVFVPARFLEWEATLTEHDRAFLKTNKISTA